MIIDTHVNAPKVHLANFEETYPAEVASAIGSGSMRHLNKTKHRTTPKKIHGRNPDWEAGDSHGGF